MDCNLPSTEDLEKRLKNLSINKFEDCSEVAEDVIYALRHSLKGVCLVIASNKNSFESFKVYEKNMAVSREYCYHCFNMYENDSRVIDCTRDINRIVPFVQYIKEIVKLNSALKGRNYYILDTLDDIPYMSTTEYILKKYMILRKGVL